MNLQDESFSFFFNRLTLFIRFTENMMFFIIFFVFVMFHPHLNNKLFVEMSIEISFVDHQ